MSVSNVSKNPNIVATPGTLIPRQHTLPLLITNHACPHLTLFLDILPLSEAGCLNTPTIQP